MATLSAIGLPALWRQAKATNTTAAINELCRCLGTRLIRATLAWAKPQASTGCESCHGPNSHSHTWRRHLVNEGNFFAPNWKQEFCGPNYEQLLSIKRRYDPSKLFRVHHGIGSDT
ncbi:MAG TPA: BBE domain-containing protein [Prochlorococcus sp.]|nr:BBE domain-containing protein [Prochlorococcus sp.]